MPFHARPEVTLKFLEKDTDQTPHSFADFRFRVNLMSEHPDSSTNICRDDRIGCIHVRSTTNLWIYVFKLEMHVLKYSRKWVYTFYFGREQKYGRIIGYQPIHLAAIPETPQFRPLNLG
jgi:hypothetical protein